MVKSVQHSEQFDYTGILPYIKFQGLDIGPSYHGRFWVTSNYKCAYQGL
jgi:hypothetical protein